MPSPAVRVDCGFWGVGGGEEEYIYAQLVLHSATTYQLYVRLFCIKVNILHVYKQGKRILCCIKACNGRLYVHFKCTS